MIVCENLDDLDVFTEAGSRSVLDIERFNNQHTLTVAGQSTFPQPASRMLLLRTFQQRR